MSGRHASYITRESASRDISFYNLDELRGENDHDNRVNAIAHAYSREDVETAKGGERGRTHYKLILSWDKKEETDRARDEAHKFLKENFEKGRGFVAIHQDTEHTHAHVWLDARGTDASCIYRATFIRSSTSVGRNNTTASMAQLTRRNTPPKKSKPENGNAI